MDYKSGDTIEIILRDSTRAKIGSWKFNVGDIELGSGILRHLIRKYGFNIDKKKDEFWDTKADW